MISAATGLVEHHPPNRLTQGIKLNVTVLSFSSSCQNHFPDHAPKPTWRFRAPCAVELRSPSAAVLCYRHPVVLWSHVWLWSNWDKIILLLLILRFQDMQDYFSRGQQSFSILYSLGGTGFGKYISSTFLLPTHLHHPVFSWQSV